MNPNFQFLDKTVGICMEKFRTTVRVYIICKTVEVLSWFGAAFVEDFVKPCEILKTKKCSQILIHNAIPSGVQRHPC